MEKNEKVYIVGKAASPSYFKTVFHGIYIVLPASILLLLCLFSIIPFVAGNTKAGFTVIGFGVLMAGVLFGGFMIMNISLCVRPSTWNNYLTIKSGVLREHFLPDMFFEVPLDKILEITPVSSNFQIGELILRQTFERHANGNSRISRMVRYKSRNVGYLKITYVAGNENKNYITSYKISNPVAVAERINRHLVGEDNEK